MSTHPFDPECDFCQIARANEPKVEVVCSTRSWLAFFPPEPATPGHTLVIPRVHVPDLWSTEPELGAMLTAAVVRVGNAIQAAISPEGMNLITSAGGAAEQTVFHLHLHVVPRWADDRLNIWPPKQPIGRGLKAGLADAIRDACLVGQEPR